MFYSQFILAKKGPLGTIWIAAHLERKLRKNQVADTDIGVSVDSILFPDVPIALRLSSHLLLGVVRIYSRKVNYLFDDCSEALLKIKQAFRSTAVDLPPEESTAPYNSITLPETFDLDDFELPDNDIFQGNFVDHHISSREQITLQDTMGGVVYSTSQFGLDERFGDGDTSGLDLDEELFLDKVAPSGHDVDMLNSGADPQASEQPTTPLKQDENHEEMVANLDTVQANIDVDQIEDVNGGAEYLDYAQGPCTPGLMEEPNVSNVHENSACDDHMESEEHYFIDCSAKGKSSSDLYFDHQDKGTLDWPTNLNTAIGMPAEVNGYHSVDQEKLETLGGLQSVVSMDQTSSVDNICTPLPMNASDVPDKLHTLQNGTISKSEPESHPVDVSFGNILEPSNFSNVEMTLDMPTLASTSQPETVNNMASDETDACSSLEIVGNLEISRPPSNGGGTNLESLARPDLENPGSQTLDELKDPENLNSFGADKGECTNSHVLRQCSSNLDQDGMLNSIDVHCNDPKQPAQAAGLCSPIISGREEAVHASGFSMLDQGEKTNSSAGFDYPAPEKLLSVPEECADVSSNLLEDCTPDKEILVGVNGGGAESNIISGKKRSFTESTLTVQSLDSVESPGVALGKRFADSIPDDDDLLSSILVGRKSSVLRVKSTPLPEITSMKRARSASRTTSSKRKVLMDDPMVLHGDTIRQQLTDSEDIRRVRKKAPCTRLEISMIQKQFLEDEIFSESAVTGLSVELASLQNHTCDLSGIKISKTDVNRACLEAASNQEFQDNRSSKFLEPANDRVVSNEPSVSNGTGITGTGEPMARNESEAELVGNSVISDNHKGEDYALKSDELHATEVPEKSSNAATESTSSHKKRLTETTEMEIDGGNISVAISVPEDAVGFEPSYPNDVASGDMHIIVADGIIPTASLDKCSEEDISLQTDAPSVSPCVNVNMPSVEMNASNIEVRDGKEVEANEVAGELNDDIVAGETRIRHELFFEGAEGCFSRDMGADLQTNISVCTESKDHSSFILGTVDQVEQIRMHEHEITNGDDFLTATRKPNTENLTSVGEDGEGSAVVYINMGNVFLGEENMVQQKSYSQGMTDLEICVTDQTPVVDHDDFDYSGVGHDTEFLNFDDDEVAEAEDDCMPNAEETRFIDNSGWSSRTRAVAKYLQTLFDKEAERGRSILPIDNLLAGKTRKEASRMFFETLVLKTKDYIHVEQKNGFDYIHLKPRAELMKSEF